MKSDPSRYGTDEAPRMTALYFLVDVQDTT